MFVSKPHLSSKSGQSISQAIAWHPSARLTVSGCPTDDYVPSLQGEGIELIAAKLLVSPGKWLLT